jgi:hypothetical protein
MTTRTAEAGNDPLIESRADMIGVFSRGEAQGKLAHRHRT